MQLQSRGCRGHGKWPQMNCTLLQACAAGYWIEEAEKTRAPRHAVFSAEVDKNIRGFKILIGQYTHFFLLSSQYFALISTIITVCVCVCVRVCVCVLCRSLSYHGTSACTSPNSWVSHDQQPQRRVRLCVNCTQCVNTAWDNWWWC